MKLRQRGNPNKNQKDYICNIPVRPKKRKGGGRYFLVPMCLPTTPPNPSSPTTYLTIPSFLSLARHSHSCSPFIFLFQSTQHTYTHSSPSPPTGTFLIITSTIFLAKSLENPQEHHTFT